MQPHVILVVDDDPDVAVLVAVTLCDKGYHVHVVPNGAHALAMLQDCQPDLILLDARMLAMNGSDFAAGYGAMPGPKKPIIVIASSTDPQTNSAEVRAAAYLPKPFRPDQLLAAVLRCIG